MSIFSVSFVAFSHDTFIFYVDLSDRLILNEYQIDNKLNLRFMVEGGLVPFESGFLLARLARTPGDQNKILQSF